MRPIKLFVIIGLGLLVNCADAKKSKDSTTLSQKDCIDAVLKQDGALGKIRNHACETISLSKTIAQYVDAINNLDYEGCPDEFRKAFKSHTAAWSEMGKFTENYPDLRGEMHDLFDSIEKTKDSTTFKPLLKAIWDTWSSIEAAKIN